LLDVFYVDDDVDCPSSGAEPGVLVEDGATATAAVAPGTMLAARLRGTSWPVSATLAPRSTLLCRDALRLVWPGRRSCREPWRHLPPRGSTGESGPAYDEESDGGGTDGYESGCGAMVVVVDERGAEDGGVVAAVAKLAGCVERDGERYGESEADEGECESGVVDSDPTFVGRWICEGGRGIATLGEARTACAPPIGSTMDVEGEDVLEKDRRCVGWKYESCADKPMRLSTGSPNCKWAHPPPTIKKICQRHEEETKQKSMTTYPPSMLDQLFPVNFIEPR
jgi:hypothetical protein